MSAIANEEETPVNLADLDVLMTDAAPVPDGDFNADPPPLPELFDANGRVVAYIADLKLGSNGIRKEAYDKKDQNGNKTGEKGVYFTADLLARVLQPEDGRELDINAFNTLVRPSGRYTSFVRKGKPMSEIAHLAKVAGLSVTDFTTVGELTKELAAALAQKGDNAVQARVFLQWQWYSKEQTFTLQKTGLTKKGKVVRYGMKNASESNDDGSYNATITHKETGETLVAKAVITKIEPLN